MEFMDALEARWACKLYDESRDVSPEEEALILEAGRLAPTSFGLEHWRFVSVRGQTPRLQLYGACLAQDGVRTAPLIVVILVRQARFYAPDSDFVRARAARFPGGWPVFYDDYKGYHQWLEAEKLTGHWARAQAYSGLCQHDECRRIHRGGFLRHRRLQGSRGAGHRGPGRTRL
jgi:nitroreductase